MKEKCTSRLHGSIKAPLGEGPNRDCVSRLEFVVDIHPWIYRNLIK